MNYYSKPDFEDWFESLQTSNSMQAAMTKQTMSIAGRSGVCSVGGDDPAHDYKLSGALPPGAVGTLRLCHDCHEICSMAGEPFVEL